VRLPQIELDDRRFQELVSEARMRIARACPEWTEHNVSDPGITLIELFAWMTEMTIYRLNRVPDKLHVALMELLGIRLDGPTAAHTNLRFRLSAPADDPIEIPGGTTEVGTMRTATEESIIFQVEEDFTIPGMRPTVYMVGRDGKFKEIGVADGTAKPQGSDQPPFGTPPKVGDALYLGFAEGLDRLMMEVQMEASLARGAGVNPEDPPLRWEVSQGDGTWQEAEVLADGTGGFNYGSGAVELQCPSKSGIEPIGGKRMHWLRCRIDNKTRHGGEATTFTHAPEIYSITAAPIGALLPAEHAAREFDELIGTSDGTPGQVFELRYAPVLPLAEPKETLEVREAEGEWKAWERRESFADSSRDDRHYTLDLVNGEVELGPSIREADGGWTQYGAVPPKNAMLRMTRYRHGGGREGNVAPDMLTMLKSPIPAVATVTNPKPAIGGVDAESITSARQRAAMEIRTRYRAVTADDFEFLVGEASPRVARAVCVPPANGGPVQVHILPKVHPADRKLTVDELIPDERMLEEIGGYLDDRRLIGTSIQLKPIKFRGISVVVNLQAEPLADLQRIEQEVLQALYTYLNPLVGGSTEGRGSGWQFGRSLNQGELYGIVHAVDGVEFVKILRLYETDLASGEQSPKPAGSHIVLEPDEVVASGNHIVKAVHREL
jgi:predicted phage baseplate assembly protein